MSDLCTNASPHPSTKNYFLIYQQQFPVIVLDLIVHGASASEKSLPEKQTDRTYPRR
jgi:hypothetical protein